MALARVKNWIGGEVLYAVDQNAEFNNLLNNALALISPLTGNLDAGGNDLTALDELALSDAAAVPSASGRARRNGALWQWFIESNHTNSVLRLLSLIGTTSGSPAAGIGTGMLFRSESGDEVPSDFGALDFVASDVGAGSEDTFLSILLRVAGRALDEKYRFSSTAGDGFAALLTHAVTADRTYTLPDHNAALGETVIRKTADETVNNSSALQNDDALLYALVANEVVTFACLLVYNSGTTPDIKFAFTVPSGAAIVWAAANARYSPTGADEPTTVAASGSSLGFSGNAADVAVLLVGVVVNGATPGDLQLQWAQQTADGSNTIVRANSWLRVKG